MSSRGRLLVMVNNTFATSNFNIVCKMWSETSCFDSLSSSEKVDTLKSPIGSWKNSLNNSQCITYKLVKEVKWCILVYKITFKTPIDMSPYWLLFDKACHLPTELEHKVYWVTHTLNFDMKSVRKNIILQLNELNEFKLGVYEKAKLYKYSVIGKSSKKQFEVGYQVLMFNSRLKLFRGNLRSRWSGSFTVLTMFPHGTVELVS